MKKTLLPALLIAGAGATGLVTDVAIQKSDLGKNVNVKASESTKAQQSQKSESTPIQSSSSQKIIANKLLDGGFDYLLPHLSNPPKVYGQYLQRTGKQKWTKKSRKCKK